MKQEKIGKFIAQLRKEQNISQEELAKKLCISRQAISKWEVGKTLPDAFNLQKLSEIFNVNVNELLTGEHITKTESEAITNYYFHIYNVKNKKKKIIIYLLLSLLLLLLVISSIFFTNNYGKTKVYQISGETENFFTNDGLFVITSGKSYFKIDLETTDEIWALINTSEKTRKHCMQLENCVYDFFELTTLNMAQQGLFGEVLHVEGSYIHNLEEFWGEYWNNWRLDYNNEFRGDVYATHGLGPACQLLDIHRGDRMKTLVAMDTKAATGPELGKRYGLANDSIEFQNGDHTMTFIRTENGKTIHIQHDVMNPRPYSRMYQLTGTDGFANKYPIEEYCLRPDQVDAKEVPNHENLNMHAAVPENVKEALMEKYKHPIHQELEETAKKVGGHGGMDYIMDYRLVYCLRNGLPLDMDVYDLAEWCCMADLTRLSIENGNAPVAVPDFTRGSWNKVKGYRHAFAK